jgi:hypothetical protein
LKNILSFTGLAVGVPVAIPHLLNVNGVAQIPDKGDVSQGFFTVTADDTDVTVTRLPGDPDNVDVYVEVWHTFDRVFGAFSGSQPSGLTPRPFFARSGAGTGAVGNTGITRWDGWLDSLAAGASAPFNLNGTPINIGANIGLHKPGSVVGLYILNSAPLTGGTLTLTVDRFAGSTGAPIPLGPGTLELVLAFGGPNLFTAFGVFAQGAFPYAAGDALFINAVTDGGFSGGEASGAQATIWVQDD